MYEYIYKYFWDGDSYFAKKQKTGKRTHFAVTKGGETTYKELFSSFNDSGTKFGSKFVMRFRQERVPDGAVENFLYTKQSHFVVIAWR